MAQRLLKQPRMTVKYEKLYRRLGALAFAALFAASWMTSRSAQAIPIPLDLNVPAAPTASEIKSLLTFPEGIPLGGIANFQASSFLGEQLLSITQLPASTVTQAGGLKQFPNLDPTVTLATPALIQQMISAIQ